MAGGEMLTQRRKKGDEERALCAHPLPPHLPPTINGGTAAAGQISRLQIVATSRVAPHHGRSAPRRAQQQEASSTRSK
ncbi:uncharacterized protein P884DRAFT_319234, partial [Thermothelomyces heterothallicus CBS 202.75]|uniref:uncharacterized protein n=1 Tax=Thermothelomyces heterothallicus CBS 202.75 TaxID=1149848 RepID=UPI00374298D4